MTNYYPNKEVKLIVDGEEVVLSGRVIEELHRQENIQWGKDVAENYVEDTRDLDNVTDQEFEQVALKLEEKMMNENGELEYNAVNEVIGIN